MAALRWGRAVNLQRCSLRSKPKEYTEAAKNKDLTKMKLLLSEATLKLHTDQAKAQKVTLDEIIQRETIFPARPTRFRIS